MLQIYNNKPQSISILASGFNVYKVNYFAAGVAVVVLLSFLQSLVQFLSPFLQALSSLPEQQAIVHLLSLQLPEHVQSFPLQPPFPAIAGIAMKAVIPTNARVNIIFFIIVLVFDSKYTHKAYANWLLSEQITIARQLYMLGIHLHKLALYKIKSE